VVVSTPSTVSADAEAKDQRLEDQFPEVKNFILFFLKDEFAETKKKFSLFSRPWLLVDTSVRSSNGPEDMTFST
jgi:hypothetical protein